MRILIAGAGIAGMTLAALLDRRGVSVELVEKAPDFEHAGYMLGLYSLGYRVLHGLGLFEQFRDESLLCENYEVFDGRGHPLKEWSMAPITDRFGPVLSSTRPQLVELLRRGLGGVEPRFTTALTDITQTGDEVRATFSDGSTGTYDLVVAADGIHSKVRQLLLGEQPTFDTHWGGWVWWADSATVDPGSFVEYWGPGRFLGGYPTTRGVGVFAGAPIRNGYAEPGPGRADRLREHFAEMGDRVAAFLSELPDDDSEMFFWRLSDARADRWHVGRVVLLGDAAVGFLPTAGIGASMAMESAAVLADELSRVDAASVGHALELFEARRRKRVESIQSDSRKLAKMMFVDSKAFATIRNVLVKLYSIESLAKQIAKAFHTPI